MALSGSPQSSPSRRVILLAIYLFILAAVPVAYRLTSVERLPIDEAAIAKWSAAVAQTGCASKLSARVSLAGLPPTAMQPSLTRHIAQWLQLASEAPGGGDEVGGDISKSWCVDWDVSAAGDSAVSRPADFSYRFGDAEAGDSTQSQPIALNLPQQPVSLHSLSLSIARRIALALRLPYGARLAQRSPITSGTTTEGQDLRQPQPEPAVAVQPPSEPSGEVSSEGKTLPDFRASDEDAVIASLTLSPEHSDATSDLAIRLPSHLILDLHVLNEDLSLDDDESSVVPPLSSSAWYANRTLSLPGVLSTELASLQRELSPLTQLGLATSWGIGKQTQDVTWQRVQWNDTRQWTEEVEMMEMRQVREVTFEPGPEGSEDAEPVMHTTMRTEPVKVKRNITRSEDVHRSVHYLDADQLEIFVDESGWDLTERSGQVDGFPALYQQEGAGRATTGTATSEVKRLHFVIYHPAKEHRPLVLLDGEDDDDNRLAQAKRVHARPDSYAPWGWVVPSWGGVIIYNGPESAGGATMSTDLTNQILPLLQDQLRLLVDLPRGDARAQWHLHRRTIQSRTHEAVQSLRAVSNSISRLPSLEVGRGVQANVQEALSALDALGVHRGRDAAAAADLSLTALVSASNAFHHPRMVGMLYFPAEHVYAVYTPLFGPLAVPLLLVGVKELKRWIRERRGRRRAVVPPGGKIKVS